MARGFFAASTLIAARPVAGLAPKCGACGLYKTCQSPKMPWAGQGKRGILLVGEAPGQNDDLTGEHFTGSAGQYLSDQLLAIGVVMERDCWMTNALICHPHHAVMDKQVAFCRPNLMRTIETLQPNVIILLGHAAVKSVIGSVWKDKIGSSSRWLGWNIPCRKPNAWLCPVALPLHVKHDKDPLTERFFRKHLMAAVAHRSPPWETIPDWESQIEVIMDPHEAARIIRRMTEKGGPAAVDYENTCLKPEYKGAEIVCCSISWRGKKTIAYPWHGEAITASRELLYAGSIGKIASNLKHEDRWTIWDTGKPVTNWIWDTMLAAHALDNRENITGLKFQSFVRLGVEAYDDHIHEFLKSKKDSQTNRIKDEVDLLQLLHYCGSDTLLEYLLAEVQMNDMSEQALDIMEQRT